MKEIAAGTFLLPGAMLPDRGPDGNTVLLDRPGGLVVVDTGRHAWHSDAILAFARDRRLAITAIVNTHWHLDHSSGNGRLKAAYPAARVYTTRAAIRRSRRAGSWPAISRRRERPPESEPASGARRRRSSSRRWPRRSRCGPTCRSSAERRPLAGRPLGLHVTADAVTAADVWIYDDATKVAVLGDLVTLPAPFFETACPARWQAALDEVWATPFRVAMPGHGAPMTRAQFDAYRRAFSAFRGCVGGDAPAAECAAGWTRDVGEFLASDADRRQAATTRRTTSISCARAAAPVPTAQCR